MKKHGIGKTPDRIAAGFWLKVRSRNGHRSTARIAGAKAQGVPLKAAKIAALVAALLLTSYFAVGVFVQPHTSGTALDSASAAEADKTDAVSAPRVSETFYTPPSSVEDIYVPEKRPQ